MKISTIRFMHIFILLMFTVASLINVKAQDKKEIITPEANVWKTEDGASHFTCPVMGEDGVVDSTTSFSEIDGKRYYHCCNGCAEKFQSNSKKYLENFVIPANVVEVGERGNHFKCPVSGEMGTVSEKTPFSDVNGKRYYFCCSKCKTAFDADANKFLQKEN